MKKLIHCIFFIPLWMHGQQRPHYTQYILNNYIVNPAISGIENYTDIKLSHRNQWTGIDGAPKTFYFTIHGPINKPDHRLTATSLPVKGENPQGKEYWTFYNAAIPHHGIGFTAINYKTGYINRTTAFATYALHVGLNTKTSISAGFGAGISRISLDKSKITLANDFDPVIGSAVNEMNQFKPEMNAGIWLYGADYFVGISAQQLVPSNLRLSDQSLSKSTEVPHLFATAGYKFFFSDEISGIPSVMTRYIDGLPLSIDANFKIQYLDQFWVGASYRRGDGMSGMFGLNVNQSFNLSYAYDISLNNNMLSTMHGGTHEIMLGFLLNNIYGSWTPRYVW